jgi:isoleucyl-tRNA synthetase
VRAPDEKAAQALVAHQDQILEELNIKDVEFIARDADIVNYRIKPNLPKLGKEGHGKNLPAIRKALEEADGKEIASAVARGESYTLAFAGGELALSADDLLIETSSAEGYACAEDVGYLAALDTSLTEDLIDEGMAREIVRSVQDARKQAGLEVADRINLGVSGSAAIEKALATHRDYVMAETLAIEWSVGQKDSLFVSEKELGDDHWRIEISKA